MKKTTIKTANRSLKKNIKNNIDAVNNYIRKNPTIKHRSHSMKLEDEFSSLDYHIVASGSIISEMYEALERISKQYPKDWEKNIKCKNKS